MLKGFVKKQIQKFERNWGYDASYLHEILDVGGLPAVNAANGIVKMQSYRKDIPVAPYYGAALVSVRQADCGPCTQLGVTMAEREGVDPAIVRAVLSRQWDRLPDDVRLTCEFAEATLAHDIKADELREQIVRRWGKRALISLAFGIAAVQNYPILKYALGYGHACVRVRVAGEDVAVPQLTPV